MLAPSASRNLRFFLVCKTFCLQLHKSWLHRNYRRFGRYVEYEYKFTTSLPFSPSQFCQTERKRGCELVRESSCPSRCYCNISWLWELAQEFVPPKGIKNVSQNYAEFSLCGILIWPTSWCQTETVKGSKNVWNVTQNSVFFVAAKSVWLRLHIQDNCRQAEWDSITFYFSTNFRSKSTYH